MEPRRSVSIFRPLMHVSPSQQRRDGSHLRQYGDDWQSWAHIGESWIAVSSTEHMSLIYECTSAERGVGVSLHACQAHHPLVSVRWDHWRSTYDSRLPFCLRSIFDRWFGVQGRVERLELHVCFGVVRCALVSYGTMDVYLPLLSNLTDACTFDFLRLRVHPPLGWWFPCRPGFPCSTGPDPSRTQDTSCSLDWVEGEDVGSPIFFFYPGWGFHPVHLWIDGWQMKTRSIVSRSWNHRFRFFLYACQPSMVSSSSSTTTLDGSHRSKSTNGSTLLILIVPTLFSKAASETTTPPGVWGWWCWVAWLGGMATEIDVTSTHGSPFKPPYPFVFVVSMEWEGKADRQHTHTHTHTHRLETTMDDHHAPPPPIATASSAPFDRRKNARGHEHGRSNVPARTGEEHTLASQPMVDPRVWVCYGSKKQKTHWPVRAACRPNAMHAKQKQQTNKEKEGRRCTWSTTVPFDECETKRGWLERCRTPRLCETKQWTNTPTWIRCTARNKERIPCLRTSSTRNDGRKARWHRCRRLDVLENETEPEKETRRTYVRNHTVAQKSERRG